jgi:uncharacterized protein YjbI with pentapeptide repeats
MRLFGSNPLPRPEFMPVPPRWLASLLRSSLNEPGWKSRSKAWGNRAFVGTAYRWRTTKKGVRAAWRAGAGPLGIALVLLLLATTIVTSGVIAYRLWRVPAWVLADSPTIEQRTSRISTYRSAQASILGVLVQAFAGLAIIAGLFFTWRQIRAGQEAQVSERYARCVEQLASERVEVRVGGIEGLERIAYDSPSEFVPIVRMLSAFVVERSRAWRRPIGGDAIELLPLDLQVALSVLQRFRDHHLARRFQQSIALTGADFHNADMSGIDLERFDLSHATFDGADLSNAWLIATDISKSTFRETDLSEALVIGASAWSANFSRATLNGACLRDTFSGGHLDFSGASLVNADCEWSQFDSSDFRGANLTGAFLYGTTMGRSHLEGVDLRLTRGLYDILAGGSHVDERTVMPGKDAAAAFKEMTKKRQHWKPTKHPDGSITYEY